MSERGRGICRNFLASGQCRFGDKCRFSHDRRTQSHSSTPGRPSSSTTNTPPPPARRGPAAGVPPRVCNYYWTSGSCSRGFECSFKHERAPAAIPTVAPAADAEQEEEPDFFSIEGISRGSSSIRDERHSLTPSDAHNHLKDFLADNFQFENASKIQGFVHILASVNDRNKTWNSGNAQAFLDAVVNGNALLRIGDVLRFDPVETAIGHGRGALSFQKGYFPILEYFASNLVLKTTMHKNINHLYTILINNYDVFRTVLHTCLGKMIQVRSWKDPTLGLSQFLQNDLGGVMVFQTTSTVLYQLLSRFRDAVRNHPDIVQLVMDLASWFDTWAEDVIKKLTISRLGEEIDRLKTIVLRESETTSRLRRTAQKVALTPAQRREALYSQLTQTYDPPGTLRPAGPRHDNDKENIADIRIAPTHGELVSPVPPYLPVFLSEMPHHLRASSMEKHLDIQFRLLREELIATTRSSLAAIQADLEIVWQPRRGQRDPTTLEQVLKTSGGAYRTSGYDSVFFQVYTGVEFSPIKAERRNLTVGLSIDTPNHRSARDTDWKKRVDYWEHSKRLQSGSLVALVIVSHATSMIFLGVVSSFSGDIAESAKATAERIQVRVSFFDAEVELMALRREPLSVTGNASRFAMLIDNNVMFEASRPFLERLQTIEPTEIPFARYIAHSGSLNTVTLNPPRYAVRPGFTYKLDCLAKKGHVGSIQALDITRPGTVEVARRQLRDHSTLDPSQIEAVLNTFNREVSLIQGPPGTGKSFTAKEILRVLFTSKIRPIVLIAFTNHALDHMLTSVLEAKITAKLVRLGARSSDERIAEYTLDKLERIGVESNMLSRPMRRQFAKMKEIEEQMQGVMESIQLPSLTGEKIQDHLLIHYPEHAECLEQPPYWITALTERLWGEEEENGEWVTKGKGKKADNHLSRTFYDFWKNGKQALSAGPQVHDPEVIAFFESLGFSALPPVPISSRPISSLLGMTNVWQMSQDERKLLATEWEKRIRELAYNSHLDEYEGLRVTYKEACQVYNDMRDETRRSLLSQTDLIGCTTTGAAKLTSLLSNISPRVLMVEEAGQVLEAHVLTSLVSSVDHLICIGDPQQLRPNLATFALSMDSERGKQLFKFDRSMMERLADEGLPMSQINVQRRMRPEISHFIRTILYPELEDNAVVQKYPHVSGMQKDVLFFTHTNKESGSDDSVSKCNDFEVEMIRDLVLYFLRQGVYNEAGDIAVLCAYLGQLQKVRAALRNLKIAVSVDERDKDQLAQQGLEEEGEYEEVLVAKHVRLGTVDIFQGQEAKIVIVSLVRNSGTFETGSASIGFLKSSNRINVALSRAKHGLYVMGNAANLRRNETWSTILNEMEARDQIVHGIPVVCARHPDQVQTVTKAGELSRLAPGGGCLLPCGFRLACGHLCPSACHAAVDKHVNTKCMERCTRTPCPRRHPCTRRCSDDCGDCQFPMYGVKLPCGHVAERVPCHMMEKLVSVKCQKLVPKRLPHCEHMTTTQCSKDPATIECSNPCGGMLSCCSKTCKSTCSDCQRHTLRLGGDKAGVRDRIARTQHRPHPCDRPLYCQHTCGLDCSQDHHCNTKCKQACRQDCVHHKCPKPCSEPCAPCMEPCPWSCAHQSCPVACGSICSRLPCDEPCKNALSCGHSCPSVCGEPCEKQTCIVCLPPERRTDIVDFIIQRKLEEVDLSSNDTSERLITLTCGHIFTVETLDGHCDMHSYYEVDPMGRFISTKAPPISYQSPPTCPTCRGPITALRYGRVTKRATLDILEQNVASKMSSSLENLSPPMERLASLLETMQESAKTLRKGDEAPDSAELRVRDARGKSTEPLDPSLLGKDAMQSVHGLDTEEAKAWQNIVKDLVSLYRRAVHVANTRGAHVKAYEAALTTLYHLEIAAITSDPLRASDTPEQTAFEAVNKNIGQPPHKADTRFQIDAYLLSLELRFMLAQVASSRVQGIPVTTDTTHRQRWVSFIDFVLESCIEDARKALAMAQRSSASRQAARSAVYIIRSDFERFRSQIVEERSELARSGRLTSTCRQALAMKVKAKSSEMLNASSKYEGEYTRSRPSKTMQDLKDERAWFNENCGRKVERWREECTELEQLMLSDKFYQPLSLQEREDIVKAFGFSHRGHFYNCENGHTFVITECGGAMQEARCPECRAPIGGSGHQLHSSNTRAREFETIARGQGSRDGAWDWTRDA
ncbi:hypothetical protein DAEQUDRAFT_539533 [Daedalea quercina L-15889]|uniref:P-loop containing nucleoside triphosphate hydrolase protein n=1 Tax=Daedalea quercina L-15889 TaxID=1314783 RepID=A0A165M341_9APHY|nr:hypothetical protein DAEQUDRAFT_539533 [Daedalea quercina L-15889]